MAGSRVFTVRNIGAICAVVIFGLVCNLFYRESGISTKNAAGGVSNALSRTEMYDRKVSVDEHGFPSIVHQMWKDDVSTAPPETLRWRDGCMKLNDEIDFRMYDDEYLKWFVEKYYPVYAPLFRSLWGIYMADMARVVMVYHYGGIYMDLDFYCVKKFKCLEAKVVELSKTTLPSGYADKLGDYDSPGKANHLLAVPREPDAHAMLFREKERVVIQDFYLVTPKHPFLKWFLDDKLASFYYETDLKNNHNGPPTTKGPFSYSIEANLDQFYDFLAFKNDPALLFKEKGEKRFKAANDRIDRWDKVKLDKDIETSKIVELPQTILHPLLDSTNGRLKEMCGPARSWWDPLGIITGRGFGYTEEQKDAFIDAYDKNPNLVESPSYKSLKKKACTRTLASNWLEADDSTIAVHMWTHTFLGFSFLRGWRNNAIYKEVETSLHPQRDTC